MENRNGLVTAAEATLATRTAKREAGAHEPALAQGGDPSAPTRADQRGILRKKTALHRWGAVSCLRRLTSTPLELAIRIDGDQAVPRGLQPSALSRRVSCMGGAQRDKDSAFVKTGRGQIRRQSGSTLDVYLPASDPSKPYPHQRS